MKAVVNHIFALMTGQRWDLMMAARGVSSAAARLIVSSGTVNTVGNDAEWPLLCMKRNMSLGYFRRT
jgi:hypothetical protein